MRTVNEVSKLSGVSIRTLQYYDKIGLLTPTERSEAGYRLYDDIALERLQQILLFRELEFPLTEIKTILDDPMFDRNKALNQQIELLTLKKERLEKIIKLAREIKQIGEIQMNFEAFDKSKLDEYVKRAKAKWGNTDEYSEFTEKKNGRTDSENKIIATEFMKIFAEFGTMRNKAVDSADVRTQVKKLQDYITKHYYKCSNEVLLSLSQMYVANEEFKHNIDNAGGEGTAEFISKAIAEYCKQ